MADTTVQYFNSGTPGAPQITNAWGSLTDMLDACLVTGFALKALTSITSANGIATATLTNGNPYTVGQVAQVDGADQPAYNGRARVLSVTANTFTYAVTGAPASPATSSTTLQARIAPLGWEKAFSGLNKRAYRSKSVLSPRNILLIDDAIKGNDYNNDTWARWAAVGIAQDMTDIDTIVGAEAPFDPNNPRQNWQQVTAGQWGWHKWFHGRQIGYETYGDGGAGSRNWVLVGDDRLFYLLLSWTGNYSQSGRATYCFGDIESFKPGDQFGTVLSASESLLSNSDYFSYVTQYGGIGKSLQQNGNVLLRSHTQIGNPVRFGVASLNTNNAQQTSGRGSVPFPNGPDYGLWLLPSYIQQQDGHMRGTMPGLFWMPQTLPYSDQTIVDNVTGQPGKRFLLPRIANDSDAEGAQIAFDISGPWR
ncbi:hypothetical protein [Xylophilus ampelinus]|uniref:Uncharacterized protein n=1 Tax=Xylophilus ampelinus TaxID=54067 RepID=A0A318T2K3_9BURK|nr:hypothetical protein [Xylophilus ampelinus]MCS4509131.1 hypothetical protein [Xylophilus ampelinus]PYE79841.1 hypothetical protein DFQ15_101161 [Xylophilus ampelinus]